VLRNGLDDDNDGLRFTSSLPLFSCLTALLLLSSHTSFPSSSSSFLLLLLSSLLLLLSLLLLFFPLPPFLSFSPVASSCLSPSSLSLSLLSLSLLSSSLSLSSSTPSRRHSTIISPIRVAKALKRRRMRSVSLTYHGKSRAL